MSNLEVLKECTVDPTSLLENRMSSILSDISAQKWEKYFEILSGPIFPTLVKEFWTNARVVQFESDDCVILSVISGFPVMINTHIISQAIECEIAGVTVESFRGNPVFADLIHIIYGHEGPASSPSTLTPRA